MVRTKGAKNVIPFEKREAVATTSSQEVKHLSRVIGATPLEEFRTLLGHQANYLKWIDDRHLELQAAKKQLSPANKGPKDATYSKYRWYAEQQTLFETINAFEVFYKKTFINLAKALRSYVPAEHIKGSIDARVAWSMHGKFSVSALIFEHQLYHDLDQVDKTSQMLVDGRRYNAGSPSKAMRDKVKALQAIFQIRHTLAHNQGLVTASDGAKFSFYGFEAKSDEVIDPTRDGLGKSVRRFLMEEAEEFTAWILSATARSLKGMNAEDGTKLRRATLKRIERTVGTSAELAALPWEVV